MGHGARGSARGSGRPSAVVDRDRELSEVMARHVPQGLRSPIERILARNLDMKGSQLDHLVEPLEGPTAAMAVEGADGDAGEIVRRGLDAVGVRDATARP